jgi:hypothetical protein
VNHEVRGTEWIAIETAPVAYRWKHLVNLFESWKPVRREGFFMPSGVTALKLGYKIFAV